MKSTSALNRKVGHVTVVGSLNMDLVIHVPRMPQIGETLAGRSFTKVHGGKGANQAVAAARLGATVSMIGCVGNDDHGKQLIEGLLAEEINCTGVVIDTSQPTGIASIVVDDAGQNTIVIVAGSNAALTSHVVSKHQQTIQQADVLIFQLEVPDETVFMAMQVAHAKGKVVILNPAPITQPLPRSWLELADYLIPNEVEATTLTGIPVNSPESAIQAAKILQQRGARNVIITLGQQGVVMLTECDTKSGVEAKHYPPHRVIAVDTTAAGDTFVGGFGAALAANRSVDEAVKLGQAAAAISVTRAGAQTSIPFLAELSDWFG